MHKFSFLFATLCILISSCSAFHELERKDNLGRVTHVSYFSGTDLIREEDIKYYGNSHNPAHIIYRKKIGTDMTPFKEEVYTFEQNNLTKLSFSVFRDTKKINTGMIIYLYHQNNRMKRIEYYSFEETLSLMYIFGLDQYNYSDKGHLISRRIIEYELNRQTQQPMQIGHYVISYKNEQIESMKMSIMDKESKKIIENNIPDGDQVYKKIETLEDAYIRKSRGREFLKN